jgi:PAS domain S-box-containing protein
MKYSLVRSGRRSAVVLSILALAIAVAGYHYHSIQRAALNRAVEEGLFAMASAKGKAVEQWRHERLADGLAAMQQSRQYAPSWEGLKLANADFSRAARAWLDSFVAGGYQRVVVATTEGDEVYPDRAAADEFSTDVRDAIRAAVSSGQPAVSELHKSPGGQGLHADLVVPVFGRTKAPAGVLILYNEVEEHLAMLARPSQLTFRSVETALVRNDGPDMLYVAFHTEGLPTLLSIPSNRSRFDSALADKQGESEGTDYRGRRVLAATVPIRDTKWWLWAKVDAEEVGSQVSFREKATLVIIFLLTAVTGLAGAFAWRAGTSSLYRELYEAEVRGRALSGHYGYLSRYSNDLIFLTDENGVIVEANERCESALAVTRSHLIGRQLRSLVSATGLASFNEGWALALRQDGAIFEADFVRQGRNVLPVEISARALQVDGREFVQAIARDIAERKRGQEDFRGILKTTTDAFCALDAHGRVLEVNDNYVQIAGIPREQLIGFSVVSRDPARGLLDLETHLANLRQKGADRWQTWYKRPDGRVYYLDISAQFLRASRRGFAFVRDITSTRQALRELEQSQRMVNRIVQTTPDLLYIYEPGKRRYTFVNRAFEDFFGWTGCGPAFSPTLPAGLIHPDDLETVANSHKALAHAPESASSDIEFRVHRTDGQWRRLRTREVVFSRTEEGEILEVLGIAEDITEQVEAAEQIRHANALLSATFNASPLAMLIHDVDGRVLRWNAAAEEMFGWSESEVLGETVPFTEVARLRTHIAQITSGGSFRGIDVTRKRKDGSPIDVSIWTAPIRGAAGEVAAIIAVVMDITEQKEARAELEKSQASLMRAHRMASLGSWSADLVAGEVEWSDETYRMFGYERGEITPGWKAYIATVHPEDRTRVEQLRAAAMQRAQPYRYDYRIVRRDGTIRHVRESAAVVNNASGKPIQISGTIQDVTEYKVLEEQLWQAQKLETVGRLAGGIAHDFNNLLTVINGYGELLLQQSAADPLMHQGLSEILSAGERAAELIKNLLTFSRKQMVEIRPVDLNASISGMESMLSRLIGDDIALELSLAADPLSVMSDPVQLQQILLNLAVNARDAMPRGGTLRIATMHVERPEDSPEPMSQASSYVLLTVSDTGTGMTADIRSHLFEPFFTTKEPGKGTGLGLSTVYGIVKQSGGAIAVDTAAGCGTTFRFYFPQAQLQPADSLVPLAAVLHPGGSTILVAEDQDDVRRLLGTMLRELGYRALATADGESALREFQDGIERIDALITDVVMPGMSGFDLARLLRVTRPDLPVLFISGYAPAVSPDDRGPADLRSCLLPKPFTREALAQKLGEVLVTSKVQVAS